MGVGNNSKPASDEGIPSPPTTSSSTKVEPFANLSLYERLTFLALVLGTGGIGYVVIPFYPQALGVVLAVAVTFLSLRQQRFGLFALIFFLALALAYQLGALLGGSAGILALLIYVAIGVALAATSFDVGYAIGVILGLFSAVLMLTDFFLVAVPLMILFVTAYRFIGKGRVVIAYLAFYLPVQALAMAANFPLGSKLLIYAKASIPYFGRVEVITAEKILAPMLNGGPPLTGKTIPFLPTLVQYFFGTFTALAFTIFLLSAVSVAFYHEGALKALHNLGFDVQRFGRAIPIISNILATVVFAALAISLGEAIGYVTPLSSSLEAFIGAGVIAGVGTASAILIQERRTTAANLAAKLDSEIERIHENVEEMMRATREAKIICKEMLVQDLLAKARGIGDEISLTARTIDKSNIQLLKDRINKFGEFVKLIETAKVEVENRVVNYHIQSVETYVDMLERAKSIGAPIVLEITRTREADVIELHINQVLELQKALDEKMKENVEMWITVGEKRYQIIKTYFDNEFLLTGVEIAKQFLNQQEIRKGAETIYDGLLLMKDKYGKSVLTYSNSLEQQLSLFIEFIENRVQEIADQTGIVEFSREVDMRTQATELRSQLTSSQTMDVIALSKVRESTELLFAELLNLLNEKLRKLELRIESKLPKGYAWGKENQIHDLEERTRRVLSTAREAQVEKLVEFLDIVTKTLYEQANTLERYLLNAEIILNYPNVDSLVTRKLKEKGSVSSEDLPFNYADKYMKLYEAHHEDTLFDERGMTLVFKSAKVKR